MCGSRDRRCGETVLAFTDERIFVFIIGTSHIAWQKHRPVTRALACACARLRPWLWVPLHQQRLPLPPQQLRRVGCPSHHRRCTPACPHAALEPRARAVLPLPPLHRGRRQTLRPVELTPTPHADENQGVDADSSANTREHDSNETMSQLKRVSHLQSRDVCAEASGRQLHWRHILQRREECSVVLRCTQEGTAAQQLHNQNISRYSSNKPTTI